MTDAKEPEGRLDGRTLRALAHPLRMRLLELLRTHGPDTASGLGKRLGESSGTTSWHLRQLADAGLVEEDTERGNRRERWWRGAMASEDVRAADFADDPEMAGPLNSYLHGAVEQRYLAEARFIAERDQWMDRWKDSAQFSDVRLSLRPEEAAAMSAEVSEIIERYRREAEDGDDVVAVHWAAFPRAGRTDGL